MKIVPMKWADRTCFTNDNGAALDLIVLVGSGRIRIQAMEYPGVACAKARQTILLFLCSYLSLRFDEDGDNIARTVFVYF